MIRTTTLLLTVALNLTMSAISLHAANIQIKSLPCTISVPGTYVLTSNMIYSSQEGPAINILKPIAGPVVLDFKGHTMTWAGDIEGVTFGVQIGNIDDAAKNTYPITIRNGTLNAFVIGIDVERGPTTELTVENMQFSHINEGIKLLNTSYSNVDNCVFTIAQNGIEDDPTGGNNSYINNTFNHVGFPIIIGDAGYPLQTIIVPKCVITVR